LGIIIKTINKEFLSKYANWEKLNSINLTFDIDFAPDYMIENIVEIIEKYNIKVTFFATHSSDFLDEIKKKINFEVGLHPNLCVNSTQGKDFNEILGKLKKQFPKAVGSRFHLLKYSYRELSMLRNFNIEYDISVLRFNSPYLLPVYHKDIDLILFSYMWEDGICENSNLALDINNINLSSPGVKIINFHPLNIFLNSESNINRIDFLNKNPDLLHVAYEEALKFRRKGNGAENLLKTLLEFFRKNKIQTYKLSEISNAFKEINV